MRGEDKLYREPGEEAADVPRPYPLGGEAQGSFAGGVWPWRWRFLELALAQHAQPVVLFRDVYNLEEEVERTDYVERGAGAKAIGKRFKLGVKLAGPLAAQSDAARAQPLHGVEEVVACLLAQHIANNAAQQPHVLA